MKDVIRLWKTARSAAMRGQASRRQAARRRRFSVEPLEGRQMLSTFTVTSNADSTAAGTLRWAIAESNATPSTASAPNQIAFNLPASEQTNGEYTIALNSALPALAHPVVINGTTQPNSGGQPLIQVDGKLAGSQASGFQVNSGASGSTIKGLTITDFTSSSALSTGGVLVDGASNVTISNDDIGVLILGSAVLAEGNNVGVLLEGGATHDIVSGDVIAGNTSDGVGLFGTGTEYNVIVGDEIGLQGGAAPNYVGVDVETPHNTIGGTSAADADIITGNSDVGIDIFGYGTSGNLVEGTSVTSNIYAGIVLDVGSSGNTVGGTAAGARDVISGNGTYGVLVFASNDNVVDGDFIGTDATGTLAQGNVDGVAIAHASSDNTIGGTTATAANVISGNSFDGVQISDSGTTGNVVEGDFLGTNSNGTAAVPNDRAGVTIQAGATGNIIGGTSVADRNIISGNTQYGVWIIDDGTTGNVVEGDLIGTNAGGNGALANGNGVVIAYGASNNTIGGSNPAAGNVISGNTNEGVVITSPGTMGNVVAWDDIGTQLGGIYAVPNFTGVLIEGGASNNLLNNNVIGGSSWDGVEITGSGTNGNELFYNSIGINSADDIGVSNWNGVQLLGGSSSSYLYQNVVAGNQSDGIFLEQTQGNDISANWVGINSNGVAFGNGEYGIILVDGASDNLIVSNNVQNNSAGGIATFGTGSGNQYYSNYSANNGGGGDYIWD
ncbi:MAG: beta strand repeat-containing protein [Isosphaeraceae bacterium]